MDEESLLDSGQMASPPTRPCNLPLPPLPRDRFFQFRCISEQHDEDDDAPSTSAALKRHCSEPTGINFVGVLPALPPPTARGRPSSVVRAPPCSPPRLVDTPPLPSTPRARCSSTAATREHAAAARSIASRRISAIQRDASLKRCVENEAASEKYIRAAVQASAGFDDFSLVGAVSPPPRSTPRNSQDDVHERKRTKSLTEPISVLTNTFLSASCSPSPTRVDTQKQCYSPSTQQIVRHNIAFSPSPCPTPSPTRRLLRSLSPIAGRPLVGMKRKFEESGGGSSPDAEMAAKRFQGVGGARRTAPGRSSPLLLPDIEIRLPAAVHPVALPTRQLTHSLSTSSFDSDTSNAESLGSGEFVGRPLAASAAADSAPFYFDARPRPKPPPTPQDIFMDTADPD